MESFLAGNAADTAAKYELHDSVIMRWRRELKEGAHKVFETKKADKEEKRMVELEQMVGKLTMELSILKKTLRLLN